MTWIMEKKKMSQYHAWWVLSILKLGYCVCFCSSEVPGNLIWGPWPGSWDLNQEWCLFKLAGSECLMFSRNNPCCEILGAISFETELTVNIAEIRTFWDTEVCPFEFSWIKHKVISLVGIMHVHPMVKNVCPWVWWDKFFLWLPERKCRVKS